MGGRVRVVPADVSVEVGDGESVYSAACRQGLRWPSICHGDAECGICWMVVREGAENLSERTRQEAARLALGLKAKEPRARLACRTRVRGDAVVERRGVRDLSERSERTDVTAAPRTRPTSAGEEGSERRGIGHPGGLSAGSARIPL